MVLFGGRSGEHEVSLMSAASVIRNLDPERFEVVPVAIDKQGKWLLNDFTQLEKKGASIVILKDALPVFLPPEVGPDNSELLSFAPAMAPQKVQGIDVVFPVMHGTFSEDGTIQGLLELAQVPYVGSGVLSSAASMDKDIAKRLVREVGLPIPAYFSIKKSELNIKEIDQRIQEELGYPVFVKPANLGSSVGIHKVKDSKNLPAALEDAFSYDLKILVEAAVPAREIEFAVLENPEYGGMPLVSAPGEVKPLHEFYSYEAKYLDEKGAELIIPADLTPEQLSEARRITQRAFVALECEGLARVDLFLDKNTGAIYFNELNTLPGFTSISMYPKLWEHSGVSYSDLLSKLIDLALARHDRRKKLKREFDAVGLTT